MLSEEPVVDFRSGLDAPGVGSSDSGLDAVDVKDERSVQNLLLTYVPCRIQGLLSRVPYGHVERFRSDHLDSPALAVSQCKPSYVSPVAVLLRIDVRRHHLLYRSLVSTKENSGIPVGFSYNSILVSETECRSTETVAGNRLSWKGSGTWQADSICGVRKHIQDT